MANVLSRMGRSGGMVITGVEQVAGSFLKAATQAPEKAVEITERHIERVADLQRSTVPVREGETRESITHDVELADGRVRGEAGPTHFVARFLQFGTSRMSPKWDALGAGEAIAPEWQRDLADAAGDV